MMISNTICLVFILLSATVQVRSQLCLDVDQYGPCSLNGACGCFHMAGLVDTGVCGFLWPICSQLKPCNSSSNACDQPDTICVQHRRCRDIPLCYPVSMMDQRICPSMEMTNSTTTITVATSTPTIFTTTATPPTNTSTAQQLNCSDSSLITFENATTYSKIPDGYYDLKWINAYALDTQVYTQSSESGFYSAVTSGTWVAFNMNGDSMTIRIDQPNTFTIKSFIVSAARENNVTLSMISQRGSTYYKEASFKIEKNHSTTIELNWFDINTITFYASNDNTRQGEVFVIDDLCLDVTTNVTTPSNGTINTNMTTPSTGIINTNVTTPSNGTINMNMTTPSTGLLTNCSLNEVLYKNYCYYLDGTGGQCSNGYSLGSESILSRIADLFIGLNYKTRISKNCCVVTMESNSNYGISTLTQCNKQGPFTSVPVLNGGGCRNSTAISEAQLTFCVSN
ncbi:unnamed protein product [Adineta steineri]|uniref:Uncharacterized protein n=1 Tax=Adineta steineri TaxID=433720 RepID=A0A814J756_9BILA|nr:unnamed protein product [Adineta steineri]CAF3886254.1 unnamed protein product [Adineta steineri]